MQCLLWVGWLVWEENFLNIFQYDRWWRPSWISDRHKKHNFCRSPSNDHSCNVCFELVDWFERRIFFNTFQYDRWWRPSWISDRYKNITFVEVHPMIIHAMFALSWLTGFRGEFFKHFPIWPLMAAILNFRSAQKHNFCRSPSNDHSCNVCFELVDWFQRKIF